MDAADDGRTKLSDQERRIAVPPIALGASAICGYSGRLLPLGELRGFMDIRSALALVAVGSLAAIAPCPSHAEVYRPWCAQYYDSNSGATNCGFVSYEQCMATARGGGAWCYGEGGRKARKGERVGR